MKRLGVASAVIGCFLIAASGILWGQRQSRQVNTNQRIAVLVRLANQNTAPQGAMIAIEQQGGGLVAQGQADALGKFEFQPSVPDYYVITVKYPGYLEASQRVDLNTSPVAYAVLELRPIPGHEPPAMAPEGPAASVSVLDYAIPAEARKEFGKASTLLMKDHDANAGLPHLKKAIKLYDAFPQAHLMLGMVYLQQGNIAAAQAAFRKVLELEVNSAAAHLALGACLNQEKDYAAAEKELTRGLELNPDAAEGHYEIAKTYWAMQRWQESEQHARIAAQKLPKLAPLRVLLGNLSLHKSDLQDALREYNEYLRLAPDGPMAAPTREMVKKVKDELSRKK